MISYRRADQRWMRQLAEFLRRRGIRPWIDRGGMRYGFPWRHELLNELKTCDAFVPLLSRRYLQSGHCRMEIFIARSFGRRIIPLMLEDCFRQLRNYEETRGLEDVFMMRLHRLRSVGLPITRQNALQRVVDAIKQSADASAARGAVYISYTLPDAIFATHLAERLDKEGIPTWIATRDCIVGDNWRDAQARAMLHARAHLVILGDGITKDDVLRTEILLAEARKVHTVTVTPDRLMRKPRIVDSILRALDRSDLTYRRLAAVQHFPCEGGVGRLARELAQILPRKKHSKPRVRTS